MKFVFFPVSENRENGLGDEGADGGNAPPQNFWARTAPETDSVLTVEFETCLKRAETFQLKIFCRSSKL